MKSGTLTSFVNQKRLPGGPNVYCRRENNSSVPNTPSNLSGYICCSSALLNRLSLRQYQVLAGVTVYPAPPSPHPGSLSPGGKIIRGILPPTLGSLPPPRKTSQIQFKTIFIFYNKFITLIYQKGTNVCFSLFCFLFMGEGLG